MGPILFLHTARALISAGSGPALTLAKGGGVALAAETWAHPWSGAQEASWQLPPPVQGRGLEGRSGYGGGGGRGVSWRGKGGRHPSGICPRKAVCSRGWRGLPRTAGGHLTTWGRGGAGSPGRLPGAGPRAVGLGDGGRGQAPWPRASAPPWPRHRGPGRRSTQSASAGTAGDCGEQPNLPPAPPAARVGGSRIPRLSASAPGAGDTGAHSAPGHPHPLRRETSAGGAGAGPRSPGKGRARERPHPPSPAPAPGAPHSPCWRRAAPLARRASLARI